MTIQTNGLHGKFDINVDDQITTGINDQELFPDQFVVHQNHPNPSKVGYSLTNYGRTIIFHQTLHT